MRGHPISTDRCRRGGGHARHGGKAPPSNSDSPVSPRPVILKVEPSDGTRVLPGISSRPALPPVTSRSHHPERRNLHIRID